MRSKRTMSAGLAVALAGLAMVAATAVGSGTAFAGGQAPPCDSTAVPSATPTLQAGIIRAAQSIPTCTVTSTPVRVKTHTPTTTATSEPTDTPVPSTPTNTPVPPTKTPTGGNEGVGVRPPNTGSGDGTADGSNTMLMVLGLAVLLGGGATVAVGARKR